jgi:Zn-finger nucleic acid-binding protein
MQSPVHPDVALQPKEIEPGLSAYQCPKSGGVWIPLASFLAWKEQHRETQVPAPQGYQPQLADDSHRHALVCPESGRLLIRYRVGHGLQFHIDLSPATGGVWLDKGEWEALKSKGLHSQMNLIFTASYQRQIRTDDYAESLEHAFRSRIGEADFHKVAAFKDWVAAHPKCRDICCYLLADVQQGAKPEGTSNNPAPTGIA